MKVDSARYTPMLPRGTDLYVISGPRHGSGYHWYEVVPLESAVDGLIGASAPPEHAYAGWVPVASRDGEAWLRRRKVACPDKPTSVKALAALPTDVALACFSGVPITVRARIQHCNCSTTGPCDYLSPSWFWLIGEYLVIAPPAIRKVEWDGDYRLRRDGIALVRDPNGRHPDPIPLDKLVTVTGMFNHPAAARCQLNGAEDIGLQGSEPVWYPSGICRTQFVVTAIK